MYRPIQHVKRRSSETGSQAGGRHVRRFAGAGRLMAGFNGLCSLRVTQCPDPGPSSVLRPATRRSLRTPPEGRLRQWAVCAPRTWGRDGIASRSRRGPVAVGWGWRRRDEAPRDHATCQAGGRHGAPGRRAGRGARGCGARHRDRRSSRGRASGRRDSERRGTSPQIAGMKVRPAPSPARRRPR